MFIEVKGTYVSSLKHRQTPEDVMSEMLRYDGGTIVKVTTSPTKWGSLRTFTAQVNVVTYTPQRWKSFAMSTKEIKRIETASLLSKPLVNSMLDALWYRNKRKYTTYYDRNNRIGAEMLKDLELREPKVFDDLRAIASYVYGEK